MRHELRPAIEAKEDGQVFIGLHVGRVICGAFESLSHHFQGKVKLWQCKLCHIVFQLRVQDACAFKQVNIPYTIVDAEDAENADII